MSSSRVAHTLRVSSDIELEPGVLAAIYSRAIERYEECQSKEKAAECDQHCDGDNGTVIKEDSADDSTIPE